MGNNKKGIKIRVILFGIAIAVIALMTVPWAIDKYCYDNEPVIKVKNVKISEGEELFSEGLVPVCNKNYKWGYMDKKGNLVIDYKFTSAAPFSEGLALVEVAFKEANADEDGEYAYGYINKKGNFVIKPQFDDAGSFSEGLAYVGEKTGANDEGWSIYKASYINKKGEVVIKDKYEYDSMYILYNDFSEGVACVYKNGKYGYIDKKGNYIIKPQYEYATDFSEGLAYVSEEDNRNVLEYAKDVVANGAVGTGKFINKKGKTVIDCSKYDEVKPFYNGVAWVFDGKEKWGILDKKGNFGGFKYTFGQKTFGDDFFLSEEDLICFDSNGYALVYEDGKAEIINTKGEVIDDSFNIGKGRYCYSNGLLLKKEQSNGYAVIQPFTDDGYAILGNKAGGQFKVIDRDGNQLFKNINDGNFYGIGGMCDYF